MKKSERVNKIKIGPFDCAIEFRPESAMPVHNKNHVPMGEFRSIPFDILINERLTLQYQAETLFHEILHAIWYVGDLNKCIKQKDPEESLIVVLSPMLVQTMNENPDIFAWIREQFEKKE